MNDILYELQDMLGDSEIEINDVQNLLSYIEEDMTIEICQPLKDKRASLIREGRVDMMFTLLYTALKKINVALKMQQDAINYIKECREGEKEKVPHRAATQAEGQSKLT